MPSARYLQLSKAVQDLRRLLLPRNFSATGTYRSPMQMHRRVASFCILAHAEIEHFLEDKALELCSAGTDAWKTHRIANDVVVGLLGFSGRRTETPPKELLPKRKRKKLKGQQPSPKYTDLKEPVMLARAYWDGVHEGNHGIKEEHLLELFLPLGLPPSSFSPTLLGSLTTFGGTRGDLAHKSSVAATTLLDPAVQYKDATDLVNELEALDTLVANAQARIALAVQTSWPAY